MTFNNTDLVPDGDASDPGGGELSIAAFAMVADAISYPNASPFNTLFPTSAPQTIQTTDPFGDSIALTPIAYAVNSDGAQEFVAYQSADGSQIVFGVEGAWNISNAMTEISTWASGAPSQQFLSDLASAAQFITTIESQNPNAQFSIAGYSLGGAEAQILGYYLNMPATAFNAPGVGDIVNSQAVSQAIQSYMPSGYNPISAPNQLNEDISVMGDLLHRLETPFGAQGTVTSSNPYSSANTTDNWYNVWTDYTVNNEISQLSEITIPNSGTTIQAGTYENSAVLQDSFVLAAGDQTGSTSTSYDYSIAANQFSIIDPPSGAEFVYTVGANSPAISALYFPGDGQDIASFAVATEVNGVWSDLVSYAAGTPVPLASNIQAFAFEALDVNGNVLTLPTGYLFFDTFTGAGTVTGALTWTAPVPQISAVVTAPDSGTFAVGSTVTFALDLNEYAAVSGAPTLTLSDGGTATYVGGSSGNALIFSYSVGRSDDTSANLTATAVNLNGGSIQDGLGNDANLSLSGVATQHFDAIITAAAGGATLTGGPGDDAIFISGGNDLVNGGSGLNTVIFTGSVDQYAVSEVANVITVADGVQGRDGIDVLNNVQQVEFSDITLVFDLQSSQDLLVYELYQAAFDRTPDLAGFRYWAGVADANNTSALALADAFLSAPEFTQLYGVNPSNTTYVTELYANVLGRTPDAAGLAYWVGEANAGLPRDQLLVDFATSPENVQLIAPHTSDGYWTT